MFWRGIFFASVSNHMPRDDAFLPTPLFASVVVFILQRVVLLGYDSSFPPLATVF